MAYDVIEQSCSPFRAWDGFLRGCESGIRCRRVFAVGRVQQMGRMIRSTESNACGIRPPPSEELGSPRFDFDSHDDAQVDRECVAAAVAMRR